MDWPYRRPIPIWCKDRPHWCDLGPERDLERMLMRASAHLDMLMADLEITRWALDKIEWYLEQRALLLAQLDLTSRALEMERAKRGQADPRSLHPANA
jgi:hypothetical protein